MSNGSRKPIGQIRKSIVAGNNPVSMVHAARTAVAAVGSYLISQGLHLPEPYWAPVSAMIVMQSTLGNALPVSVQRFAGTAAGAAVGGLAATFFHDNVWVFGLGILLLGLVCAGLNVERTAYRYAGITMVIVMLVTQQKAPWILAFHRFFEVSLGIAVGLLLSAVWPEKPSAA